MESTFGLVCPVMAYDQVREIAASVLADYRYSMGETEPADEDEHALVGGTVIVADAARLRDSLERAFAAALLQVDVALESTEVLYHVSDGDILGTGVDHRRRQVADWRTTPEEHDRYPRGNYLTNSLDMAFMYQIHRGGDIFAVHGRALPLRPDPDPEWYGTSFYTTEPIPPQHVHGVVELVDPYDDPNFEHPRFAR